MRAAFSRHFLMTARTSSTGTGVIMSFIRTWEKMGFGLQDYVGSRVTTTIRFTHPFHERQGSFECAFGPPERETRPNNAINQGWNEENDNGQKTSKIHLHTIPEIGDLVFKVNSKPLFDLLELVLLFVSHSAHAVGSENFTKVSLPTGATGSLCWSFGWLDFVVFVFGIHSRRNTLIWWVFFFLFRLGQRRQTRGDGAVEVTHGVKDIRHTLTKHLNASVWWSNSKDQVGWNRQTKPNSYKIKDDRRRHRHMSRLPRRRKTNRVERKKRDQITKDIRLRTRDQRGTPRKKKRRQTIHRQNWGLKF